MKLQTQTIVTMVIAGVATAVVLELARPLIAKLTPGSTTTSGEIF